MLDLRRNSIDFSNTSADTARINVNERESWSPGGITSKCCRR